MADQSYKILADVRHETGFGDAEPFVAEYAAGKTVKPSDDFERQVLDRLVETGHAEVVRGAKGSSPKGSEQ